MPILRISGDTAPLHYMPSTVCTGILCYLLPEGVKSLGRPMHRWDIKINLKETGWQDVH
jgi:hypothetical protein